MISYNSWMKNKGFDSENRRIVWGEYITPDGATHNEGRDFEIINVDDDAEKSYKLVLDYWNETLHKEEQPRAFVRAKWVN